jgi:elongation factor Ts
MNPFIIRNSVFSILKMDISADLVKKLRAMTGAGVMDCKVALKDAEGDTDKAIEILKKKGLAAAAKRADRVATEGLVGSYIHAGGKIGVLVEVNCETDFVARTEEFQSLVKDISMHVAASNPQYFRREDIPSEILDKEREIYRAQVAESGKPEKVIEKIVDGKMEKYFAEVCLYEQPFVKDTDKTVRDLINDYIAKFGENISVRRFIRFHLGEGLEKK